MEMALGMSEEQANNTGFRGTDQGTHMKTDYGWYNGGNGTNSSGFSSLPGGYHDSFSFVTVSGEKNGWWWTSSLNPWGSPFSRTTSYHNEKVGRQVFPSNAGCSVRCMHDPE